MFPAVQGRAIEKQIRDTVCPALRNYMTNKPDNPEGSSPQGTLKVITVATR